jgi:hypothetical protein
MFDDYPVAYRSDSEIEEVADETRRRLFGADLPRTKILEGLRRFQKLTIVPQPDDMFGDYDAYVSTKPKRLFCRQSVYDQAQRGDVDASGVLAHEVGHFVLHPAKEIRFLATGGNEAPFSIHPNESAERQAWLFADAFQIPSWSVWQVENAAELARLCNVPPDRAEKRWHQVRQHPVPQVVQSDPIQAAWELAIQIRGKDPQLVRKADNYQIERVEANKMTHCGWLVRDGRPIAWMMLDHQWF